MREDRYSNDEAGAAYYERQRGLAHEGIDRPDVDPDDRVATDPPVVPCRRAVHSPLPDGTRATGCVHCPSCGADVVRYPWEEYFACSARCGWSHGTPSQPPF